MSILNPLLPWLFLSLSFDLIFSFIPQIVLTIVLKYQILQYFPIAYRFVPELQKFYS